MESFKKNLKNNFKFKKLDLKKISSIKIGYKTRNIIFPENREELKSVINYCLNKKYNFTFTGGHTNILFHKNIDNRFLINFNKFQNLLFKDGTFYIESGVFSSFLAAIAYFFGIKGYEFLHLLPGSIGGAVFMNARCYGKEMKDIVNTVETINSSGREIKYLNTSLKNNLKFSYKHSIFRENREAIIKVSFNFPVNTLLKKYYYNIFKTNVDFNLFINELIKIIYKKLIFSKKNGVIFFDLKSFYNIFSLKNLDSVFNEIINNKLLAVFNLFNNKLKKSTLENKIIKKTDLVNYFKIIDRTDIYKKMEEIENDRVNKKHFLYPSLGSIFKNNYDYGIPMGKLIENIGLKGYFINDAQISETHGNIIINKGNANSEDVLKLIQIIKSKIKKNYGFIPEEEIIIL